MKYQLEMWQTKFGKQYTDRNTFSFQELERVYKNMYGIGIAKLNQMFLNKLNRSIRILEVGCNTGNQLVALKKMGFNNLYGIEPQGYAVDICKKRIKDINVITGNALDIPFKDGYFDLVFTAGVLIHIPPSDIKKALGEIHRCSRKYICGYEYYSGKYEVLGYRDRKNLMWKNDFAKLYLGLFDDLKLIKEKRLKYLLNNNIDSMFLLRKQ